MREALPSYLDAVTVVAGSRDGTILEREDRMRRASFMVSSSLEASRCQIIAFATVRFSGGSSIWEYKLQIGGAGNRDGKGHLGALQEHASPGKSCSEVT